MCSLIFILCCLLSYSITLTLLLLRAMRHECIVVRMKSYKVTKKQLEEIVIDALSEFFKMSLSLNDPDVYEELCSYQGYPNKDEYIIDENELRDLMVLAMKYVGVTGDLFEGDYVEFVSTLDEVQ